MNIFLNIFSEYKYDIAEWLITEKGINEVTIPIWPSFYQEKDLQDLDDRIKTVNIETIISRDFIENYDLNELEPIDEEMFENLKEYEGVGIHINAQSWVYPTGIYDEARRDFYFYVRYWNSFFKNTRIDAVIYDVVPHWPAFYPMYAVARMTGVRTFIIQAYGIRIPEIEGYVCAYGDTIETLGDPIDEFYTSQKDTIPSNPVLNGLIKKYFEISSAHSNEAAIMPDSRKKWKKYVKGEKYSIAEIRWPAFDYFAHNFKLLVGAIMKHRDINKYLDRRYTKRKYIDMKRCYLYKNNDACSLRKYEKMAVNPDYSVKYIYFPLQLWPEASTLPQAGVFDDQISSIMLLSSITREFGIKIYVKEYYLQPYRARSFYRDLQRLENVQLIHSNISSDQLLRHALAAANQTGTVLIEAPFYGVPALTFGSGFGLKGMPGLYRIRDVEQGKNVISQILQGITIGMEDLKKYYYALQQNSVFFQRTPNGKVDVGSPEYEETVKDLKRVLQSEVLTK